MVVWCSGWSNMNELQDEVSYDQCDIKNVDKTPRSGPISYAVNTARPGPVYLASGVEGQCQQGWKVAVNVQEFKVSTYTNLLKYILFSAGPAHQTSHIFYVSAEACIENYKASTTATLF